MKGKNLAWNCASCNTIGNDLNSLKVVIISLQNEVKKTQKTSNTSSTCEEIIVEFDERLKRKNNAIFFGIAEQDSSLDKNARVVENRSVVSGLMKKFILNVLFLTI